MHFAAKCPACGKTIRVAQGDAGQKVQCYLCGSRGCWLPAREDMHAWTDELDPETREAVPIERSFLGLLVAFVACPLVAVFLMALTPRSPWPGQQISFLELVFRLCLPVLLAVAGLGMLTRWRWRVLWFVPCVALLGWGFIEVARTDWTGMGPPMLESPLHDALAWLLAVAVLASAPVLWALYVWRSRRGRRSAAMAARRTAIICTACVVWLLLLSWLRPALASAEGHRRVQCWQNLRAIGQALKEYHDINDRFPPAVTTDATGRPMHGWIAYLLPYLEEADVRKGYDYSQPWDSETNAAVVKQVLMTFQCPTASEDARPVTHYRMLVGPNSIGGTNRSARLQDVADGAANTVIVVEASDRPIRRASPEAVAELSQGITHFDPTARGAGSLHYKGAFVLFADGTVRWLDTGTLPATLRALCTKSGSEPVSGERP